MYNVNTNNHNFLCDFVLSDSRNQKQRWVSVPAMETEQNDVKYVCGEANLQIMIKVRVFFIF